MYTRVLRLVPGRFVLFWSVLYQSFTVVNFLRNRRFPPPPPIIQVFCLIQWNPSIVATIRECHFVHYRGVALSHRLICTKRVYLGLSEVAFVLRGGLYEGFHSISYAAMFLLISSFLSSH